MFKTVLIANRGEIAVRIARTLKKMGIRSVAVYSEADQHSLHVQIADCAVCIGPASPAASYLNGAAIIQAALDHQAEAIIPGYGFLSENADFADACEAAGLVFCGPTGEQMRRFGLKHAARELACQAGVPLTPGSGLLADTEHALAEAQRIGYPVMLKSTAGGGGIGLARCNDPAELQQAFESVQRQGQSFFSDSGVFVERYIDNGRHVEVQIFGDGLGNVIALGERDCSIQRRNQKIIEETPAPGLSEQTRQALLNASAELGRTVGYRSAGTVEYIYDAASGTFYFLEVNTRLQVEHGITELVTGIDLVEWMIRTAAGAPPDLSQPVITSGAAIEVRVYAEDPLRQFQPSPGELTEVVFGNGLRVDGWIEQGTIVSPHYDPMLAKLMAVGKDRAEAVSRLAEGLAQTRLSGIATNLEYLRHIVASPVFSGQADGIRALSTGFLAHFSFQPAMLEILEGGTYSTVQDYPGRTGYWDIGVPPSGPMDSFAFRLGNRIVGNHDRCAAIETTIVGMTVRFHAAMVIALTGASGDARLDGVSVPCWQPVMVKAGQLLAMGAASTGCRTYLAIRGGIDVPDYLGSKSTFALGHFGGHAGRVLRTGDTLRINLADVGAANTPQALSSRAIPVYPPAPAVATEGRLWSIRALYGPHGAPDFFTEASVSEFFAAEWRVHHNSNRLGIRLNGPKPSFARTDGGEAGLHPSNIHDCEYAIGSVNFTGDMPVILAQDGPSLGGFVCLVTIAKAELWKVGQVRPGDRIRFVPVSFADALSLELEQDAIVASLEAPVLPCDAPVARWRADTAASPAEPATTSAIVASLEPDAATGRPGIVYRQAGDKYLLIEYGLNVLDLSLRFQVHALMQHLAVAPIKGIAELSPGVRSLQIRYDSRLLSQSELVARLIGIEKTLPPVSSMTVPSRIIRLPMAFEDSATLDAVARYRQSVKDSAPWLPSNTEFMRRINGLDSVEDVRKILFDASYMVLGLGDVYLGAPCAVPVDPRHRLLTSKYNPARTYTAEGTVGIGGVYMCIYGMDSPGGYQLVGRTLPIWNKFLKNPAFVDGQPWLLRFFDQVRYVEVTETELDQLRQDFRAGTYHLDITEEQFSLADHQQFERSIAGELARFRAAQQAAFDTEVAHWKQLAADEPATDESAGQGRAGQETGPGSGQHAGDIPLSADISGSVWKLLAAPGDEVRAGQTLLILEAMKMEFSIFAPQDAIVRAVYCRPGQSVTAGEILITLDKIGTA